ncbi:MAG: hypothetical protein M0038_05610 [Pseudomonadota bacterium]|jgi:hypothetical protein|nr:hypothetical protein [Pseudomonadota bacterium]
MKLHEFMMTRELVGPEFSGPSWSAWRVVARLIDGDGQLLTDAERAVALRLTGRTRLPTEPPREIFAGAGRRSGKSRFGSLVAVWLAAQEYPQLAAGETAVVVHVAPDRDQSQIDLRYARGIVEASPLLSAELDGAPTREALEFRHGTRLEVATASYRTVRGRTMAGAVIDESAFLRSDDSALPDIELARALRPALLTLNGLLLVISSPHRKVGLLYNAHRKYYANDNTDRALYIQAESRDLNPTLDESEIAEAMQDDPAAAQSEYLGLFRADLAGFLDDATVDAAIIPNRRELAQVAGTNYVAFCDPSGGRADSFTLAIAHVEANPDPAREHEPERLVLDAVRCVAPPFDPETAVAGIAETLREYGLSDVSGDKYGAEFVVSAFARHGITYSASERNRSDIYLEILPHFSRGAVELLDNPLLRTQLLLLERRPRSTGRDSVDHPRGAHDDLANAVCGALLLAAGGGATLNISDAALERAAAAAYEWMLPTMSLPPQAASASAERYAQLSQLQECGALPPPTGPTKIA